MYPAPQRGFRKQNRAEQNETREGINHEQRNLWEQRILYSHLV